MIKQIDSQIAQLEADISAFSDRRHVEMRNDSSAALYLTGKIDGYSVAVNNLETLKRKFLAGELVENKA